MSAPLLEVRNLRVRFKARRESLFAPQRFVHAVDDVSFLLPRGMSLGLVGESGSGKTTVARAVMQLVRPWSGEILFDGNNVGQLDRKGMVEFRKRVQFIFQDPYSSLNPRSRAGEIIQEPMNLLQVGDKAERRDEAVALMESVGLRPEQARLFPHQFSGGQRQRIAIARALASRPEVLCCDEPVSALDVAVQAQILNLLKRLQQERGISLLFISHDLGVVQYICDHIIVLYLGRVVESASANTLFSNPLHPYTRALLAAVPQPVPPEDRKAVHFKLPSSIPTNSLETSCGCRYASFCRSAMDICRETPPCLVETVPGKMVACHLYPSSGGA